MSGLAMVVALATQVVTLDPARLERHIYVRVGVGVDSRLELEDGLMRLHGHRATADLLGLKVGHGRPTTMLLMHPRESGSGRLVFVGQKHTIRLLVEAAILGTALNAKLRVGEPAAPGASPSPPPAGAQAPAGGAVAPGAQAPGKGAVAPAGSPGAQTPKDRAVASGAQTPRNGAVAPAGRARPRAARAARSLASPVPPAPSSAPDTPAPPSLSVDSQSDASAPQSASASCTCPTPSATTPPDFAGVPTPAPPRREATAAQPQAEPAAAAPRVMRLMRRIGRPGERGVIVEELRREGSRLILRARVEGAAAAQSVYLTLGALPATLELDRSGRDLVLAGTITDAPLPDNATLVLDLGGRWHTTRLPLPQGGSL